MKITVPCEVLSGGLRRVLTVVSPRTTLPVLNNVLLETDDGQLFLTTTDLEVSIRTAVAAEVAEAGATTLPAKKLGQITSSLAGESVELTTDENQISELSCGKSFFRMVGLDAKEFPRDSQFDEEWSFTMPTDEFRKLLLKVSYSSSTDETRHVLNGILLSVRSGVLTVAATDGRRLALLERPFEDASLPDGDVILPAKLVSELEKSLTGDSDLQLRLTDSRAALEFGTTLITSKLVEGTYPNYRQVVPADFKHSVGIPRELLGEVLNRVSMVVSESAGSVKFGLEPGVLTVSATSNEYGDAKEPIDVSYEGDPLEIAFNPQFLVDPLRYLECDQLVMQFNDEFSPVSLSGDEGFLYVVMPMRG